MEGCSNKAYIRVATLAKSVRDWMIPCELISGSPDSLLAMKAAAIPKAAIAKVTPWLEGDLKPQREGVYERRSRPGAYSCWNGKSWNEDAPTPFEAALETRLSHYQGTQWRGLAEPSALPCATCKGHTVVDRGFDEETGADRLEECPDC